MQSGSRADRGSSSPPYRGRGFGAVLAGSAVAAALKALGALLWIGFYVLLGRRFGPQGVGAFAVSFAIVTITSTLSRLGLDNVLVRHVAAYREGGNTLAETQLVRAAFPSVAAASLVVAVLIEFAVRPFAGSLFHSAEVGGLLWPMALAVPCLSLSVLSAQYLRGAGRIAASQLVQSVLIQALTPAACLLMGLQFRIVMTGYAYLAAAFVTLLVSLALCRHSRSGLEAREGAGLERRAIFRAGMDMLPIALSGLVIQSVPVLLLGGLSSSAQTGLFHVSSRMANLFAFLLLAVNVAAAPMYSRLHAQGDLAGLERLSRQLSAAMLVLAALPAAVVLAVPHWVLGLFGEGFEAAAQTIRILVAFQLVSLACGSVGYLLMMTGNERVSRHVSTFAALVTVLGAVLLIPRWGSVGGAVAVATGLAITNVGGLLAVRWRLGFWSLPLLPASSTTRR